MSHQPTPAEILAAAALNGFQGHPVTEAIAQTRAGKAAELTSLNPLILVDTIRMLAILGEHELVDRAYAEWRDLPDGSVHFEAGLAALMASHDVEAEARFSRAVSVKVPQPMAWNSLALVRVAHSQLDAAKEAIDAGLASMPGDVLMRRTAALVYSLKGDTARAAELDPSRVLKKEQVTLILERFAGHAQLAREASEFLSRVPPVPGLDVASARTLLERRADELDGRGLMRAGEAPKATPTPALVDCRGVSVWLGDKPKVRLVLSPAEADAARAGNILRFTAELPDGPKLVHLQRNDVTPAEPAPSVRLRVIPSMFEHVKLGTVTPLFPDVPFLLELSVAGNQPPAPSAPAPSPKPRGGGNLVAVPREKEDPLTAATGTFFGGVLMLGLGALRAALSTRASDTNTLMMLIGAGMLIYGGVKWLSLR